MLYPTELRGQLIYRLYKKFIYVARVLWQKDLEAFVFCLFCLKMEVWFLKKIPNLDFLEINILEFCLFWAKKAFLNIKKLRFAFFKKIETSFLLS